jgi:hypothetical protein
MEVRLARVILALIGLALGQNDAPASSEDVEATKRIIDQQMGPVALIDHSYAAR